MYMIVPIWESMELDMSIVHLDCIWIVLNFSIWEIYIL